MDVPINQHSGNRNKCHCCHAYILPPLLHQTLTNVSPFFYFNLLFTGDHTYLTWPQILMLLTPEQCQRELQQGLSLGP